MSRSINFYFTRIFVLKNIMHVQLNVLSHFNFNCNICNKGSFNTWEVMNVLYTV